MDSKTKLKKCFKCNEVKPLSEFYRHGAMKDGHLNKCKECTKKDVSIHRAENIDKIRAYDRARGKLPGRVFDNTRRTKIYRADNPMKWKAHMMANNAIRSGVIEKQPCVVCGRVDCVEKHHPDYSKPLDVVFLCSEHHSAVHYGRLCLLL